MVFFVVYQNSKKAFEVCSKLLRNFELAIRSFIRSLINIKHCNLQCFVKNMLNFEETSNKLRNDSLRNFEEVSNKLRMTFLKPLVQSVLKLKLEQLEVVYQQLGSGIQEFCQTFYVAQGLIRHFRNRRT